MASRTLGAACCGVPDARPLRKSLFHLALLVAAMSCNKPETPPAPVVPVRPLQPQAATPDSPTLPAPPPKEAPANAQPDAPASPTAAPSAVIEKPSEPQLKPDKPNLGVPTTAAPAAPVTKTSQKNPRVIHPASGSTGCLEMYGSCTAPPDQLCTTSAFYLDCGKTEQLPSNGDWIRCVCP